jgi:hypothetical protein
VVNRSLPGDLPARPTALITLVHTRRPRINLSCMPRAVSWLRGTRTVDVPGFEPGRGVGSEGAPTHRTHRVPITPLSTDRTGGFLSAPVGVPPD